MKAPALKALLSLLALAAPLIAAPGDSGEIRVEERRDGGRVSVVARNTDPWLPRWIELNVERAENMDPDRALPARAALLPGQSRELLWLRVRDPSRPASYALASAQGFGDPDCRPDPSAAWLLPFEHGTKHAVGQGYLGEATHQGIYALDFDMPEGTTICASRSGLVAAAKDDSDQGGSSPAYARLGNYVEILHEDGTWSTYAHLRQRGALVRVGERVRAGDPIALSGSTGQASGPHLHFSAQKARYNAPPETFATAFSLDEASRPAFLEEGGYYYAWHPGLPAFERKGASSVDEAALERQVKPASGGKLRFREEKLDNKVLLYCVNPTPQKIELTVSFASSRNVTPSRPLPLTRIVPARSEVFLISILMKGQASYETRFSYRPLP